MRRLFCHEEELLRQFANTEFGCALNWRKGVVADDIWGEHDDHACEIGLFNVNFRTTLLEVLPSATDAKVMQIHPGYLNPAVFVTVDRSTRDVYSFELLRGEQVAPCDYPHALSLIEQRLAEVSDSAWRQKLNWWRVFAMLNRVFFLVTMKDFCATCSAERNSMALHSPVRGECSVLWKHEKPIGLEGWIEHPTGFGVDAVV